MWETFRREFIRDLFLPVDAGRQEERIMELFTMQALYNPLYAHFLNLLRIAPATIRDIRDIPFLPVELFKSHAIQTGAFIPELTFTSSGTSGQQVSRHLVRDTTLYKESLTKAFRLAYGDPGNYCILALLPSYLERSGSSLVYMVQEWIRTGTHPRSGMYLYDHDGLARVLAANEASGQPTLLIGVTFALLDFAARYPMDLKHTLVMETGGMKGRREELTRNQVHEQLRKAFGRASPIHSEYGMTEMLSQAYSQGDGLFSCPPWMTILVRDTTDPLRILPGAGRGAMNVTDLANVDSCAFLAVSDLGEVLPDGRFTITGRFDQADVRGCNLMVA
ncbi:MAG: acyl transferase [Flavobacteriales bacterium]